MAAEHVVYTISLRDLLSDKVREATASVVAFEGALVEAQDKADELFKSATEGFGSISDFLRSGVEEYLKAQKKIGDSGAADQVMQLSQQMNAAKEKMGKAVADIIADEAPVIEPDDEAGREKRGGAGEAGDTAGIDRISACPATKTAWQGARPAQRSASPPPSN